MFNLGTTEIIFIAVIALIIFGPRKLPEYAKKIGKLMNEFRTASREFKNTWEREVELEEERNSNKSKIYGNNQSLNEPEVTSLAEMENRVFAEEASETATLGAVTSSPMVKEIDPSRFSLEQNGNSFDEVTTENGNYEEEVEEIPNRKRDWL